MVFTPLVSPAVTPLDTHFRMPDYAVPGEYFSPLTSPALQAQVHSSQRLAYDVSRVSEAPDAASPIATTFDAGSNKSGSIQPASKRTRKNSMCAPNKVSSRSVRESPAMKPQRKKQSSSNSIITKDVTGLIEAASEGPRRAEKFYSKTDSLNLPISQDTSEVGSISPEPLSEILMPPPAAPKSNSSKSPSLNAKSNSPPTPFHPMGAPVTPASLMKLQGPSANSERTARWTCKSPVINAMTQDDSGGDQSLQRGNSHSHTNLAMNKNVSGPPSAAGPTLCATSAPQRPESKAPAKSNKRTNSSHPSPALRPRVSPSIKPLLPEGSKFD